MSKRNLIILIISLLVIAYTAFSYLSSMKQTKVGEVNSSGINFISEFFPFIKKEEVIPEIKENPADISGYVSTENEEVSENKLKKVSNIKISGYGVFMKERFKEVPLVEETINTEKPKEKKPTPPQTEFVPALKYVEKVNGNIYQTFADKIEERKITTTFIPKVQEAFFGDNGDSVVMRYFKEETKTIETFAGSLPKEILGGDMLLSGEVLGSFLPENISDLSISGDTSKIFYLFSLKDNTIGTTSDVLGDKKTQIFNSPFSEWLSSYPNNNMITLTTKPSSQVLGYMYSINPSKKNFTKILGDISGLTTLTSPDGKSVLFSDSSLFLKIFNINKNEIIAIGPKTLAEKCVWNKTNTYIYCAIPKFINSQNLPDDWYQGETSFSDQIWKIDALTGNAYMLIDPKTPQKGEDLDMIKLSISENEEFLFFIDKNNSYLWEFDLR